MVLSTSEARGDFVARLMDEQAAGLDALGQQRLGLDLRASLLSVQDGESGAKLLRDEARLGALALRELGLESGGGVNLPAAVDEQLAVRRCALPEATCATIPAMVRQIDLVAGVSFGGPPDLTMLCPDSDDARTACLLSIRDVDKLWLGPMHKFCRAFQPSLGSSGERAAVKALLRRCGWSDQEGAALRLVLDTLHWDTVELLHFALELLRRQYDVLWLPLAAALEADFSRDAVLPLRKLLDPELKLILVAAAPDKQNEVCLFVCLFVCWGEKERKGRKKKKKRWKKKKGKKKKRKIRGWAEQARQR